MAGVGLGLGLGIPFAVGAFSGVGSTLFVDEIVRSPGEMAEIFFCKPTHPLCGCMTFTCCLPVTLGIVFGSEAAGACRHYCGGEPFYVDNSTPIAGALTQQAPAQQQGYRPPADPGAGGMGR